MDHPVYVYINITGLQSSTKEYTYDFKFHFKMIFFIALYSTVEPRSIVPVTIVFPHVLFAIFGPE